ncbi:GMC family oxidoreductase [Rhodococcus opacus]|uniref:GMC family oxidoreductase n=1 Tax=Rhodococcus opacus TaxID=37919 RepID=UPI00247311B5|nr:GMC oxidoreductase [Rhodococcus opacus]MDH6293226.1 choline dehydrogenase [Rhodococcus opacus]
MGTSTVTLVVGAGAAGGVVAARLSEDPDNHVILIEAGPDFASKEDLPPELEAADFPQLTAYGWGLDAYHVEGEQLNPYPRGKVLGGSSSVNGAVFVRGRKADFDGWAAAGNPSWSWDRILPEFIELESDQQFGELPYHGSEGPVRIERTTDEGWPRFLRAYRDDLAASGVPATDDVNAPDSVGVGHVPRNRAGKYRESTLITHITPARTRKNFEVCGDTLALRVIHERGRATGVEVDGPSGIEVIPADRVVLSGGAFISPMILMHSGIGDPEELGRVGIETKVELPGVGNNLQDHPGLPLIAEAVNTEPGLHGFRFYARDSSGLGPENDIAYTPGQVPIEGVNFPVDTIAEDLAYFVASLALPNSRGWLKLRSADPHDLPDVHLNFLSDPSDVERLKAAYRPMVETALKGTVSETIGKIVIPGPEEYGDDILGWLDTPEAEEWMRRAVLTSFHLVGTCKMGPASDPQAVVDDHLRVHGFENLYVADASIMPSITSGMTNASSYLIGHHFVTLLRADAA